MFFEGLRLDLSTISYLAIIPLLIFALSTLIPSKKWRIIFTGYQILLIIIISLISVANIRLYKEWGTLVNYRALSYLMYPKEVFASLTFVSIVFVIIVFIIVLLSGLWLNKKINNERLENKQQLVPSLLIAVVLLVIMGIGMRGGIQLIPINESSAYFSNNAINNHLSTNSTWFLVNNILENRNDKFNPYIYLSEVEAKERVKNLFPNDSVSTKILKTNRPNIILIVLESYTADLLTSLGGEKNISPNLDSLCSQGILFTDIYSSGFRTDQGIVSILSGFPSQPDRSIIKVPDKQQKLPFLNRALKDEGYKTSFYYGGESAFANMSLYLVNSGFDKIIDKSFFSKKELNSKWGAHDEFVFNKQLVDLKEEEQPFFSVLLTLSNHEPFEIPIEPKFPGKKEADQFRNSAFYTDKCIGDFINTAKQQPWFKNTLFVFVADHGHRLPLGRDYHEPAYRRIPLLFYGDVVKDEFKNKRIEKTGNHHDIPKTLLSQLNIPSNNFNWSKDLLNDNAVNFAFLANETGFGWITPLQKMTYFSKEDKTTLYYTTETIVNDSLLKDGKAFIQILFQQYLDY